MQDDPRAVGAGHEEVVLEEGIGLGAGEGGGHGSWKREGGLPIRGIGDIHRELCQDGCATLLADLALERGTDEGEGNARRDGAIPKLHAIGVIRTLHDAVVVSQVKRRGGHGGKVES